jgi:NAD(P)-dependent dehydrogenase (short-subunit alcohol dehydrogenase family)
MQFANAGIVDFEVLSSTTSSGLTRMLDVNVVGAFNSVQWAARGMMNTSDAKPKSGGSIIITVSQKRLRTLRED